MGSVLILRGGQKNQEGQTMPLQRGDSAFRFYDEPMRLSFGLWPLVGFPKASLPLALSDWKERWLSLQLCRQ